MTSVAARVALKERLPRTWSAFFERYGTFTPVQLAALPLLLDGDDAVICAPTAGGKTAAALAPLIERHCRADTPGPVILYIVPTRALVSDLAVRLAQPCAVLGLRLGVRTGDRDTVRGRRPPHLLLTTPESADALLATRARDFIHLQAVVLDELHLLDGTPRGDHLRVLLNRLRAVRAYAAAQGTVLDAALQGVALSATLEHPAAAAARYLPRARVVQVGGGRAVEIERLDLEPEGASGLRAYLDTFRARGWRKALVFCNSRAEIEAYAAAVRERSPFGDAVYVHYSNIEARRRRETERRFADDAAAILFASSTLELGIDIGDIDLVILIGAPGSTASFAQRLGRGNRRRRVARVTCCARTPLERLLFDALCATVTPASPTQATGSPSSAAPWPVPPSPAAPFRPGVAVQQIFSLLRGSPTAALRLAGLVPLFAGLLTADDLSAILGELRTRGYLDDGRPGEWRAGVRLQELMDRQSGPRRGPSIHGNIQQSTELMVEVRDQQTQQVVARVDRDWLDRPLLTLEGRPINVAWSDGEALWVTGYHGPGIAERLIYRSRRQLLSYDLAARLPAQLGLAPGVAPWAIAPEGWWWFHWLGDLYGRALLDLWRYEAVATATSQPGLALCLLDEPRVVPAWSAARVRVYLEDNYRALEPLLALGPFHGLLPPELRRRAVVAAFDLDRFVSAVGRLRLQRVPEALADDLGVLLGADPGGLSKTERQEHRDGYRDE